MSETVEIIPRRDGRVGRILLNRPRVLNTLTLDMVRTFTRALHDFAADPHVHAVVVEGAGDRAFCAGGDIRALRDGSSLATAPRSKRSSARNTRSTTKSRPTPSRTSR